MRRLLLLLAFAAVVASCGGEDGAPSGPVPTTAPSSAPAPGDSAAPAPDFSMDLFGGESFSLGAETKPVYMVFWAEW